MRPQAKALASTLRAIVFNEQISLTSSRDHPFPSFNTFLSNLVLGFRLDFCYHIFLFFFFSKRSAQLSARLIEPPIIFPTPFAPDPLLESFYARSAKGLQGPGVSDERN